MMSSTSSGRVDRNLDFGGRGTARRRGNRTIPGKAMRASITHVLGARPNFVKAAPVIRALAALGHEQRVIHTGQHYDEKMSDIFFVQLGLPEPDVNLGAGSGSHARQTADIMVGLEREFTEHPPSVVIVYGDVNSTVAAGLAAVKLGIPLAHVEAGLRSFDAGMPEEWNRRLTDQMCDILFATSPEAIGYLAREGRPVSAVHLVGNPMIDTLLANLDKFDASYGASAYGLSGKYVVATLHRPANVDNADRAAELVAALHEVAADIDVIIPLHPRGRATLTAAGLLDSPRIRVIDPLGYIEFMSLVRGAAAIITDSGGVQEETTLLRVPCLTLRPNTERPITITSGSNRLVTVDDVAAATAKAVDAGPYAGELPPLWDGQAGPRIARILTGWLRDSARGDSARGDSARAEGGRDD
jgi:UDP-N-acetylglucosamine 2-epimerase